MSKSAQAFGIPAARLRTEYKMLDFGKPALLGTSFRFESFFEGKECRDAAGVEIVLPEHVPVQ